MFRVKDRCKRLLASVLTAAMILTNVQIPSFAAESYPDYLDGWKVQVAWSNLSTTYKWDTARDETRQPKLLATYRIENAKKAYGPGDISFTIPGVGNAYRGRLVKASQLAADAKDSEWNYTWDQTSDTYTFTNKFNVEVGESVNGGFEFLYTFNSRSNSDGFKQTKSPKFSVAGAGEITLEPLNYSFTSVRDGYQISMSSSRLGVDSYADSDHDYIWYDVTTRFQNSLKARGLYRSDYFVTIEPNSSDITIENLKSDMVVTYGGKEMELTEQDGKLGFYPFKDRSGDIALGSTSSYSFRVGFKKDTLTGKSVKFHGHLDRLYNDDAEWTRTNMDNGYDDVDCELTLTAEDYHFTYNGFIYHVCKGGPYPYASAGKQPPSSYSSRLPAKELYSGKVIQFSLHGSANRSYSMAALNNAPLLFRLDHGTATPAEADEATGERQYLVKGVASPAEADRVPEWDMTLPDGIEDWNDIDWKEHGLGEVDEDLLTGTATYGEATEYHEVDEDGTPISIPDIIINAIKSTFSASAIFSLFGFDAYGAEPEKASPAEADKKDGTNNGTTSTQEDMPDPESEIAPIANLTNIGEDDIYGMILGDDKLAIRLAGGGIRELDDDEYDFAYVTVPSNSKNYEYEIWGATTQNARYNEYTLIPGATGNTSHSQTFNLPQGYKAIFVKFKGIVGSSSVYAYPGIRIHLDWDTEQAKDPEQRIDPEANLVNFDYLRSVYVKNGQELTDNVVSASSYLGSYAELKLSEHDQTWYGEYLQRDYANVYLRNPVTTLGASARINGFSGGGQGGFNSTFTASGSISADNSGSLKKFSLFAVVPEGTYFDLDGDLTVSGSGTYQAGGSASAADFLDHATITESDYNGSKMVVVDFDFSETPLEIQASTSVSVSFPITLSYADFVMYGSSYSGKAYMMPLDAGLDKITGSSVITDSYDINKNGNRSEYMATASDSEYVYDTANEWREFASKYVKSAFSNGYVTDTVTRMSQAGYEKPEESLYSYRLDFGVGSLNAKNIVYYDRLEQGATIAVNGSAEGEKKEIPSEWQGEFVDVDTSYAERMGMKPTVYYSSQADAPLDYTDSSAWSTVKPATVRSIAVLMNTDNLTDGVMKAKQMCYVIVNMKAPSDVSYVGKKAVNQYFVQYDGYDLTNHFVNTMRDLPSSETYIQLLDTIGKLIIQKADGDNVTKTDPDGTKHYANLTGATFQIYDPDGNALFGAEGKEVGATGRLVVSNIRLARSYGNGKNYQYEELEAPRGYQKLEGRYDLTVDGLNEVQYILNKRIPGEVYLTKNDYDYEGYGPLEGAEFELYTSDGIQVKTDTSNKYSETGTKSVFTTDSDGKVHITGLPWGTYYFVETAAPDGYEVDPSSIYFTVNKGYLHDEGEYAGRIVAEVVAQDEELTASLRLIKTDATSKKPIRDAVYDLYRVKRSPETEDVLIDSNLKTNAVGEIEVHDLKFGEYYFKETASPGGYMPPTEDNCKTKTATLDVKTVGDTLELTHENIRSKGAVRLFKEDDFEQPINDVEFDLYYRKDTDPDGTFSVIGHYTTKTDGSFNGIIDAKDLEWGDYYFKETKAPKGYDMNTDPIEFTIDQETVQNVTVLHVLNNRTKGSIKLTKVDKDTKTPLEGAEYELYRTDGSLCVAPDDYQVKGSADGKIVTGADGTVTLTGIRQGGYYLKEVTAPTNYSLSEEYVRFTVNLDNAEITQELTAEDEKNKAYIVINKEIDEIYDPFGNPTFLFVVTGTNGKTYTRSITLQEMQMSGSATITVEQGYTYTIKELESSRYLLSAIEDDENITSHDLTQRTAVADLNAPHERAEVTFRNEMTQYEKFSSTSNSTNLVKAFKKLTGIKVNYVGPDTLSEATVGTSPGYDASSKEYTFQKGEEGTENDMTVTAFYDDGSSRILQITDYSLDPATVFNDGVNTSATVTVTYTENGITKTDSFQVTIALPDHAKPVSVILHLNGGTLVIDADDPLVLGNHTTAGTHSGDIVLENFMPNDTLTLPQNEPTKVSTTGLGLGGPTFLLPGDGSSSGIRPASYQLPASASLPDSENQQTPTVPAPVKAAAEPVQTGLVDKLKKVSKSLFGIKPKEQAPEEDLE